MRKLGIEPPKYNEKLAIVPHSRATAVLAVYGYLRSRSRILKLTTTTRDLLLYQARTTFKFTSLLGLCTIGAIGLAISVCMSCRHRVPPTNRSPQPHQTATLPKFNRECHCTHAAAALQAPTSARHGTTPRITGVAFPC